MTDNQNEQLGRFVERLMSRGFSFSTDDYLMLQDVLPALSQESARRRYALEKIANYGKDGICPFGCDCPNIAMEAQR